MRNEKGQFIKGQKLHTRFNVTCRVCAVVFVADASGTKYCDEHQKAKVVECVCKSCKKTFSVSKRTFKHRRAKYCSIRCDLKDLSVKNIPLEKRWNWKGGVASGENRREYVKKHRKNNQAKYAFYSEKRRMSKLNNGGSHTFEEWVALKKKYNFMCLCCKRQEPFVVLSEDHVIPVSFGGSNDISNIQPLCRSCNSKKHARYIDYRTYARA